MHPIIYDVAVSLNGYICGPDGDVSGFAHDGDVVVDYGQRLSTYRTAIMGRATYEFGYRFGMVPGQNPYPHMNTLVFSSNPERPDKNKIMFQRHIDDRAIGDLRRQADGPIYLCGGGQFAGALLQMGMIDRVILRRAPIVLGGGVSLFGDAQHLGAFRRDATKHYDNGYVLEEFVL